MEVCVASQLGCATENILCGIVDQAEEGHDPSGIFALANALRFSGGSLQTLNLAGELITKHIITC